MKNVLKLTTVLFLFASLLSCHKDKSKSNEITYDADAQKFIDSSGIADNTQKVALNNFVIQLKDSSLWTKFIAIYPMVGGTAATTKWNLKDSRDLDAAYRLTFNGTPVFATTGVLFPTIADYANTHLADSLLSYNNNSISYYSRTQNTIDGYDMGCADHVVYYNEFGIYNSVNATNWFGYYEFGSTPSTTTGLFMLSSTSSDVKRYENAVVTKSKGNSPTIGYTNYPVLIGYVAGASSGGQKQCALATIGNGLTDAEALTFYNIVENFESKLSRQMN